MFGNTSARFVPHGSYGQVWRNLRLVELWSLESGSRICFSIFGRNLASVAVKTFLTFN